MPLNDPLLDAPLGYSPWVNGWKHMIELAQKWYVESRGHLPADSDIGHGTWRAIYEYPRWTTLRRAFQDTWPLPTTGPGPAPSFLKGNWLDGWKSLYPGRTAVGRDVNIQAAKDAGHNTYVVLAVNPDTSNPPTYFMGSSAIGPAVQELKQSFPVVHVQVWSWELQQHYASTLGDVVDWTIKLHEACRADGYWPIEMDEYWSWDQSQVFIRRCADAGVPIWEHYTPDRVDNPIPSSQGLMLQLWDLGNAATTVQGAIGRYGKDKVVLAELPINTSSNLRRAMAGLVEDEGLRGNLAI